MDEHSEHWMQRIVDRLDRLIEIGERVEGQCRLPPESELQTKKFGDAIEKAKDHFVGVGKMVAEEPPKEPPKKLRILQVGEEVEDGDWECLKSLFCPGDLVKIEWAKARSVGLPVRESDVCVYARPVAEEPPKEEPKKWRIRQPGERVQDGDWLCHKSLPYANDPLNGPGWIDAKICVGLTVLLRDGCVFACPVADEPAKEPAEHPAGPKPDPGDGYRILSKEPLEELTPGDEFEEKPGFWVKSSNAEHCGIQANRLWYRRKIEQAKEPSPAWEPKVDDLVLVRRPKNWKECRDPEWVPAMHRYDGQVIKISRFDGAWVATLEGIDWFFHRDWLSPATTSRPLKLPPPQPEYREPVLPGDAGQQCEFSDDGSEWHSGWLDEWRRSCRQWISHSGRDWRYCRIKKDA